MLKVARERAYADGLGECCEFRQMDFLADDLPGTFDYAIVCGFMDYMPDPVAVVAKVLSATRRRAVFSFPVEGGLLAWQRRIRYRHRCPLYLYTESDVQRAFNGQDNVMYSIEKIARDFFVTADVS
jgi:hypothetical protein